MRLNVPILSTVEKAVQDELRKGGRQILKRARELSPTDSGESDKSGFSVVDDLTLQVGFKSLVSRLQHENLEWQHTDGGQAKFLEAAVDECADDINAAIAAAVRQGLGG